MWNSTRGVKIMKQKTLSVLLWVLGFILSVFLLLMLSESYSDVTWVTFSFTIIAFASQYILWLNLPKSNDRYYDYPIMTITSLYLVTQFILCIVFGLMGDNASIRITILINVLLVLVAWAFIILILIAMKNAQRVEQRQKNNHREL